MDYFYDIALDQFVDASGSNRPLRKLAFMRDEDTVMEIRLQSNGAAYTPEGTALLTFAIKQSPGETAETLAIIESGDFTEDAGVYTGSLALNGESLSDLLGADFSITLYAQLSITDDDGTIKSRVIPVVMSNDIVRGTEGTPSALPDPDAYVRARAVVYDAAQSLTSPQQAQARANIGVTPGTTDYNELDNVPTEFPPSAHDHVVSDITPVSGRHLIGRHANGSGDAQEVTVSGGLEFSGSGIRRAALTGDVTASAGSASTTLAGVGTAGTYRSVTTDAKGRVTAGTNPTTLSGYGITDAAALVHTHVSDDITDATDNAVAGKIAKYTSSSGLFALGLELYNGTGSTEFQAEAGAENYTINVPAADGTLALTSDLTAKANLTGGNTFSGTQNNSGEVRSTAALSGDGTQILNRNQVDGSAADFIWTPIVFNTPAGTAAGSVALSATQFTMAVNSGSLVGETKYASSFIGPFLDIGSITTQIIAQRFSAYFDLTPQSQMDECPLTLLFGVGATVTSIASVAGLAVKFTNNTVKLQIHNGTTLEESSAITIPNFNFNTNNRVLVTWDGNTLRLYMKNWSGSGTVAEQRYTLIGSLAHSSALPATFSGVSFVVARTVETTTTATATLRLRSCQTLATALTPNL